MSEQFEEAMRQDLADRRRENAPQTGHVDPSAVYPPGTPTPAEAAATSEVAEDAEPAFDFEIEFRGETIQAFYPEDNQMIFLMAALGRGQSGSSKFASMINLMMETLTDGSRDMIEPRMITRDKATRLEPKDIEELFSKLSAKWSARPTK